MYYCDDEIILHQKTRNEKPSSQSLRDVQNRERPQTIGDEIQAKEIIPEEPNRQTIIDRPRVAPKELGSVPWR